jgi:flagellar hook assembly protein FlgD
MDIKRLFFLIFFLICIFIPCYARGNKEPPEVTMETEGPYYISPNGDEVQDNITVKFTVKVIVKSEEGYVPEYGIQIKDSSENIVRDINITEESDKGFFGRLFSKREEFNLTKEIFWDGTDNEGNLVPDGEYIAILFVMDYDDNLTEIPLENFIIDTIAPEATLTEPDHSIFSPNNDGNWDTYLIQIDGTEEHLWEGFINTDSGVTVKTYQWENSQPDSITWDGMNDSDEMAENGIYNFELKCTDKAGNGIIKTIEQICLDNSVTNISLLIENSSFSPNNDGIKDTAIINLTVEVKTGIAGWALTITDEQDTTIEEYNGITSDSIPESIEFMGKDNANNILPEGKYIVQFDVKYENGNHPVITEEMEIDVTKPVIDYFINNPIFSPNDDGKKDNVTLTIESNENITGPITVEDSEKNERNRLDILEAAIKITWDGTNTDGDILPDGEYTVLTQFSDLAGNPADPANLNVVIDTTVTTVGITVPSGFSPNGDGEKDTLTVSIEASMYSNVDTWAVEFFTYVGSKVSSITGEDVLPEQVTWDGMKNGEVVSDGAYMARLIVSYEKGDYHQIDSGSFMVDTVPPEITLETTQNPFIKTEDKIEGEVFITIDIEDESDIEEWFMDIINENGDIIRSFKGEDEPTDQILWTGETEEGDLTDIITQDIIIRLTVKDSSGNENIYEEEAIVDIFIVKNGDRLYLMVPNIIFGAYQHNLNSAGTERYEQNIISIQKVYEIFSRYPGYTLILEGHALNIYLDEDYEETEETILFPLTQRRADTVKNALIDLGISDELIKTEPYGGQFPITPVLDWFQNWKNRRVEFVLE